MSKQDDPEANQKTYELPSLDVGDVLLVGKFPRIAKLMPA